MPSISQKSEALNRERLEGPDRLEALSKAEAERDLSPDESAEIDSIVDRASAINEENAGLEKRQKAYEAAANPAGSV